MVESVFARIEQLNESYCQVWEDFCSIESPSLHKEGVDAAGNFLVQMAQARGWQVEYGRQSAAGDVICITLNPDVPAAPLAVSAHIDTVHPVGLFGTPPVHRDAENICGPGVTDCKGGAVAGFLAMDALERCGYRRRPVQLLLQSEEEVGSRLSGKATINWICEKAKDAVAFLNLEPSTPGFVCLKRKGIVSYRFTVTGKEAHASMCAAEGANAIADAAYRILELEKYKDPEGITCNCGVISGGTVTNTVPGSCSFAVDFRFANGQQFEQIAARVKELAAAEYIPGCTCAVEQISMRVAMELEQRNLALLEKCNAAFAKHGLPVREWRSQNGGSDAADVTAFGIPCIDSLGVSGGYIHSVREYARLDSLAEAARRIAVLACEL